MALNTPSIMATLYAIGHTVVFPTAKCRLRLLKLERIKDFLLLEKEYIRNQEVFKVSRLGVRGP